MHGEMPSKVTAAHLQRDAYLYVRQSTVRQVIENTESTQRQYALRDRAVALGWPVERVHVIDCDLGHSGASTVDREGFQKLVAEVGMGRVGIVLGLEVSRLARNCADWHRLLELCALSGTLILDEDGLYDPNDFNDRLLLGLKGTMSEAELHLIRARLRGGILSKARRGELALALPVGLVYDDEGRVQLDPDAQVRESLARLFQTFRRTGTAFGTVKAFRTHKLLFPRRLRGGPCKGQLAWGELSFTRAVQVLHNPRYAGVYTYGRLRSRAGPDGRRYHRRLPRDQWLVLLPNAHAGYLSWEEYEENQERLRQNAQALGQDHRKGPPREGPALLQGLALCGRCGQHMTVHYRTRGGRTVSDYVCQRDGIEQGRTRCQRVDGRPVEEAVGDLLVKTLTPMTLEVALQVQEELVVQVEQADRLRAQRVERGRYEADLARERYLRVDPRNRMVADALEADWNDKLRALRQAQEDYERERQGDHVLVDPDERARILALATDFPRLWHAPTTPDRERKRMVRLLIEDVTLLRNHDDVTVHVRFKGGPTTTLTLPRSLAVWERDRTPPEVVARIDQLLDELTEVEIACRLNQEGLAPGRGRRFNRNVVRIIRRRYGLKSRRERLREAGFLTLEEITTALHVHPQTIRDWQHHGLLKAHACDGRGTYLFDPPGPDGPVKAQGRKLSERRRFPEVSSDHDNEVQYEA